MEQSAVTKVVKRAAVLAVVAGLSVTAAPIKAQTSQRPIGDIEVFATLPYPGHPGGLAVAGRTLYVNTSNADFDRLFDTSDEIWAFRLDTGEPIRRVPNPIQVVRAASVQTMGLLGMALDAQGRLYAADMNGRVVRVDPSTGAQEVYATIPTNTDTSLTDMPGFVAFGSDGSLYVGDWAAPVVWRVPRGGGQEQPWFGDPRLAGTWGANVAGIAVDPSGEDLYIAAGTQEGQIAIYRLPLAHADAAHLEEFHRYTDFVISPCDADPNLALVACAIMPAFGGGGIAFGAFGRLYVALFAKQQLSILDADGTEALRFPSPEENAERDIPINGPFGLAFDGRGSLLVANTGDPTFGKGPGGTDPPGVCRLPTRGWSSTSSSTTPPAHSCGRSSREPVHPFGHCEVPRLSRKRSGFTAPNLRRYSEMMSRRAVSAVASSSNDWAISGGPSPAAASSPCYAAPRLRLRTEMRS